MAIRRSLNPRPCVVVTGQPGTIAAVETDCQSAPLIVAAPQPTTTITCVSSTNQQQQHMAPQVGFFSNKSIR